MRFVSFVGQQLASNASDQRGSHVAKCFAEVHSPEPILLLFVQRSFQLLLCTRSTPMFSLQFLNEFDWISADSNNRHHTGWTAVGRKFSTVHAVPGCCELLGSSMA